MKKDKDNYSPNAVYTIIPQQDVSDAYVNNGTGTLTEGKLWKTAKNDFDNLDGKQMVLLLADASSIKGVEWIAIIKDIKIDKANNKTIVSFTKLTKLEKIFTTSRITLRNGNKLSPFHIRPYVLCKPPTSLLPQLHRVPDYANDLANSSHIKETTSKQSIVESRTTQSTFRKNLIKKYKKCAVTGCTNQALLIASHIVRWADATDAERQDIANGLLLAVPIDYLFDSHLISFDKNGKILISKSLTAKDRRIMGIETGMKSTGLSVEQHNYLSKHRAIFNKLP